LVEAVSEDDKLENTKVNQDEQFEKMKQAKKNWRKTHIVSLKNRN